MTERSIDDNFYEHYKDTGCKYSPSCLVCPLAQCVHDVPFNQQFKQTMARRDAERANAVAVAEQTMIRHKAIARWPRTSV